MKDEEFKGAVGIRLIGHATCRAFNGSMFKNTFIASAEPTAAHYRPEENDSTRESKADFFFFYVEFARN